MSNISAADLLQRMMQYLFIWEGLSSNTITPCPDSVMLNFRDVVGYNYFILLPNNKTPFLPTFMSINLFTSEILGVYVAVLSLDYPLHKCEWLFFWRQILRVWEDIRTFFLQKARTVDVGLEFCFEVKVRTMYQLSDCVFGLGTFRRQWLRQGAPSDITVSLLSELKQSLSHTHTHAHTPPHPHTQTQTHTRTHASRSLRSSPVSGLFALPAAVDTVFLENTTPSP